MVEATAAEPVLSINDRSFRIGSVIAKTFRIYFRHFISFNLIGISVWIPLIVSIAAIDFARNYGGIGQNISRYILFLHAAQNAAVGALILLWLLYPISTAIIFHATFRALRDGKVRIRASIAQGFARGFWVILLAILGGVALAAATSILLVPLTEYARRMETLWLVAAILPAYLTILWSVALPACVVEGLGPIASMGRSRRLTLGHRWRILIVMIIFSALITLLGYGISALMTVRPSLWFFISVLICIGLVSAFGAVVPGVIYHELRHAKEGRDIQSVASVFD